MIYKNTDVYIEANDIQIGENVSFGNQVDIRIAGRFSIGDRSCLGDDVQIRGNNVQIGSDLYHGRPGLQIGGGGSNHPEANLTIGDRCTVHDNFININRPVVIGDDVGLSPGVDILTHGFWLSVLDGYPASFAGVTIEDGVIVGWKSTVLMGVTIGCNAVIGANSVVTKSLDGRAIYAGNPAKFIRYIVEPHPEDKQEILKNILREYQAVAAHHRIEPNIVNKYPLVIVNGCKFNVETLMFSGKEDVETDDFRDYMRRWGIRFYSERPFRSQR